MTLPRRWLLIALFVAALFLLVPRLIARAVPEQRNCSWGASSVVWQDGRVIAGPDVTGCAP